MVDAQFALCTSVRLIAAQDGIPVGALGSVLGRFVAEGTYVVNFAEIGSSTPKVVEVRADEIAPAEFA